MPDSNGETRLPTSVYRSLIGVIVIMAGGAVAMSGWALATLNSLSVRLASVEATLAADKNYHDRAVVKLESELTLLANRLETKIDKLADLIQAQHRRQE